MSEITRGAIGMPFEMAMESELSRRQFHSAAQALLVERDQLKAENEALHGLLREMRSIGNHAPAELTLRVDAALGKGGRS